jgi:hypothetical protein
MFEDSPGEDPGPKRRIDLDEFLQAALFATPVCHSHRDSYVGGNLFDSHAM